MSKSFSNGSCLSRLRHEGVSPFHDPSSVHISLGRPTRMYLEGSKKLLSKYQRGGGQFHIPRACAVVGEHCPKLGRVGAERHPSVPDGLRLGAVHGITPRMLALVRAQIQPVV